MNLSKEGNLDDIGKSLTAGYFWNTAKLTKAGIYKTIKSKLNVFIHPSSIMIKTNEKADVMAPYILFYELVFTTKEYMRIVTPIKGSWLVETSPHYFTPTDLISSK